MGDLEKYAAAGSPVQPGEPGNLEEGLALCLSGGGYRAMLFHTGALWRLNELGYLPRLDSISSVSGGSITAAVLGMNWNKLQFDARGVAGNLDTALVQPIRKLAGITIDQGSILGGIFTRGTISEKVAGAYRKHLFGEKGLQDLPDRPRFVINATSVQTGALWRFSKPYMADYKVGVIPSPHVQLALAVAASSAFPPFLSPLELQVDPTSFDPTGNGPLNTPPYTSKVVLSDGGVYDNLGLETAWKRYTTILISDGGGQMTPEPSPKHDWARHALRINSVIDNQVRDLRKRQAIAGFIAGDRQGTYWGIRSDINDYGPPQGALPCPTANTLKLAQVKTRLAETTGALQERLMNWGYAVCDAAMRTWVEPTAAPPGSFPFSGEVG
jgi:NTE family protein